MRQPSGGTGRRAALAALPWGLAALLTSCTIDRITGPPLDEGEYVGPTTVAEALELAELAPVPEGVEAELLERQPANDLERWACEVTFTAAVDVVDPWLAQSYGDHGPPARAWEITTRAEEAFGIGEVPDTWLFESSSLSGVPYTRMVLIDDQDPRTVRVHLAEIQD